MSSQPQNMPNAGQANALPTPSDANPAPAATSATQAAAPAATPAAPATPAAAPVSHHACPRFLPCWKLLSRADVLTLCIQSANVLLWRLQTSIYNLAVESQRLQEQIEREYHARRIANAKGPAQPKPKNAPR